MEYLEKGYAVVERCGGRSRLDLTLDYACFSDIRHPLLLGTLLHSIDVMMDIGKAMFRI